MIDLLELQPVLPSLRLNNVFLDLHLPEESKIEPRTPAEFFLFAVRAGDGYIMNFSVIIVA
jgi:hypothetical protein